MNSGPVSPSERDVVVIGAGIVGLAAASHLQAEGRRVLLIDRKGIAQEASCGNAGALAYSHVLPIASPDACIQAPKWLFDPLGPLAIPPAYLLRILPWMTRFLLASRPSVYRAGAEAQGALMRLSMRENDEMFRRTGTASMVHPDGCLEVYESEAAFRRSLPGWEICRSCGIELEFVRGARLAELQPGLAPSFVVGVFIPQWQTVSDPRDIAEKIGEHILAEGGELLLADVARIAPEGEGVRIGLADGRELHARQAVIAAGAWSKPLAAMLGDRIPLETERGYNTTLPPDAFDLKRQITFAEHAFVVTRLSSGIRVGGAVELGGLALPPNYKRSAAMLTKAKRFLPGLETGGGTQWMGFRPSIPDSLPVIGPSKASERVVYAFGHGHLGLTHSAATGRLVAEFLCGRPTAVPLAPFRANRFGF